MVYNTSGFMDCVHRMKSVQKLDITTVGDQPH
jgi:hypothetical protein